jgi:hypothetical protein
MNSGTVVAGKQLFGQDTRNNKDSTGKVFGLEQYAAAQKPEGQITEVPPHKIVGSGTVYL